MNISRFAKLDTPIEVKRTRTGKKTEMVSDVFIDFWDGICDELGKRMGYPETIAFPILANGDVAHHMTLHTWHDKTPDFERYAKAIGATLE